MAIFGILLLLLVIEGVYEPRIDTIYKADGTKSVCLWYNVGMTREYKILYTKKQ